MNGGFAQVEWVDEISLDEGFLAGFPDAQPITIAAGAFGPDRPRSALTLSPHQRVAVGDSRIGGDWRMARDLMQRPGVMRRPENIVRYFLFHCGAPATVMVEGLAVSVAP